MRRLILAALAAALMAVATFVYATHRRHWADMTCEDYVALLEGEAGVTFA